MRTLIQILEKKSPPCKVFLISRANPDIRNAKQFSPRTTDHGFAGPIHWHFCPTLTWAHSKPRTIFTQFNFPQFLFLQKFFISYQFKQSLHYSLLNLHRIRYDSVRCTYLFIAWYHNIWAHKWHPMLKVRNQIWCNCFFPATFHKI